MEYLIIIMMVLAVYHFVLQAALIPTWRSFVRYEAFALRDELRALKMNRGEDLPDAVFYSLQGSANFLIADMWRITIFNLIAARRVLDSDPDVRKRVNDRLGSLDKCNMPEVIGLRKRMTRLSIKAAAINAAGWWIYIVPVVWAVSCAGTFKRLTRMVLAAPQGVRDHMLFPSQSHVTAS
ncbi:hypothetical protein [Bordetella petrii]|uniref:hypothetical protein n=1 Tax=Bordetella petrii TaxID=94624 RepID=UPI00047BF1E9|nr:hypothetical protein [Bordetella petrii]